MDDPYKKHIDKIIQEELQSRTDLLPPWAKYPEIPRYSIGWRMGAGETYMWAWDEWIKQFNQTQLLNYFKKYSLIPIEWLDWVANRFGYMFFDENPEKNIYSGVKWLEEQGLANYSEFEKWYQEVWKE